MWAINVTSLQSNAIVYLALIVLYSFIIILILTDDKEFCAGNWLRRPESWKPISMQTSWRSLPLFEGQTHVVKNACVSDNDGTMLIIVW